jgi:hypothetical protein
MLMELYRHQYRQAPLAYSFFRGSGLIRAIFM